MTDAMPIWVVYQNTDLTEGRGSRVPIGWYACRATAKRKAKGQDVQGCDAEVREMQAWRRGNDWYGPIDIKEPTKADLAVQAAVDAREAARVKAQEAGLTPAEIAALRYSDA